MWIQSPPVVCYRLLGKMENIFQPPYLELSSKLIVPHFSQTYHTQVRWLHEFVSLRKISHQKMRGREKAVQNLEILLILFKSPWYCICPSQKNARGAGMIKCFSHKLEGPSSTPQKPHEKLGMTEHTWNPSASGMETGRSLGLLASQSIQSVRSGFSETPSLNPQGRVWPKRTSSVDPCPQPPYICTYTCVHAHSTNTHIHTCKVWKRGLTIE